MAASMEVYECDVHQVFVKLLDGKHIIFNFDAPTISVPALKRRVETVTSIPSHLQLLLLNNSRVIHDDQTLSIDQSRGNSEVSETLGPEFGGELAGDGGFARVRSGKFPVVVNLLLRLRGGKGGFGSLLRGAATKAGQKKTNNFDACRDMSGRRLRHVNAEKKLEEWRAEAEDRKLEKMAEDFIKKKTKEIVKSGKSNGGDGTEKYVAKYREVSARCMEEVERSVRESVKGLMGSKRKSDGSDSASKRLKIWMGKRTLDDSDSEDLDEDDSDEEEKDENEKSVVIDNGSHSDSSKEADASSGSVTCGKVDAGSLELGSSGSGSEGEDTVAAKEASKSDTPVQESLEENKDHSEVVPELPENSRLNEVDEIVGHHLGVSGSEDEVASAAQARNSVTPEAAQEESVSASENLQNSDKPLDFNEYNSAAELEVLGMEKLKSELQARGLKCGGTLQERAARLFLLKTTPVEKLPKKLFARK